MLSLIGVIDSIYLSISHYRNYADIGYSSFCAISKSINCDTVSQSSYSILLGIPVPLWGVMGYGAILVLLILAWKNRHYHLPLWSLLFVISLGFSLYSVILAFISGYFIRSYCIMCLLTYGINLLLLFYTWVIRKRFELPPLVKGVRQDISWCFRNRLIFRIAVLGLPALVIGMFFFPAYWQFSSKLPIDNIATGKTIDGHPWIGATNPEIEIVEYTDYMCFQCRKMHFFLRELVARYPNRVRLVHKQFPMDNEVNAIVKEPFHVGSGRMAIIALYAAEKNKFWQMNDALFKLGGSAKQIDLTALADQIGLDPEGLRESLTKRKDLHFALARDIWDGIKLKITGTPSYVINGKVYLAQIPADIINAIR